MGIVWGRVPLFWRVLSLVVLQLALRISRVAVRWRTTLRSSHLDMPVATGRGTGTGQPTYRCTSAGRARTARTPTRAPGAPRTARPPTDAPRPPSSLTADTPPSPSTQAQGTARRQRAPSLPTPHRPRGYGLSQDPCRDGTVAVPWEVPHSERIVCDAVPKAASSRRLQPEAQHPFTQGESRPCDRYAQPSPPVVGGARVAEPPPYWPQLPSPRRSRSPRPRAVPVTRRPTASPPRPPPAVTPVTARSRSRTTSGTSSKSTGSTSTSGRTAPGRTGTGTTGFARPTTTSTRSSRGCGVPAGCGTPTTRTRASTPTTSPVTRA